MKEGKALLKTLEGGMWKWQEKNPGNGRTISNFECNVHEDCKRELRVVKVNDVYVIQGRGSHGEIPKQKKRANSTLTNKQEKLMRFALDMGGRPAGIRVAMTKEKMQELEGAGEDPFLHKDDMGGLIGALLSMMASIHSPKPPRYVSRMYPACIPHVSSMYPACILISYEDTCIPHVSRMYPACIPHLRYVPLKIHYEIHVSHNVSTMYPACILITLADTCIPHVFLMYPACILHLRYVPLKIHLRYMCLLMYLGCIPHVS
jgi:hypothetical protein